MPVPVLPHPFDADGDWLRCALHAHTTNSDGSMAPEMLVGHYDWAGFDVLAITDHWVRTVERSTKTLLVIPGAELNATLAGSRLDAHVVALGIDSDPVPPDLEFDDLPETIAWVAGHGGLPILAHTYWSGLRTSDFERCDGLALIEVYNAACELEVGRGLASLHWDEALEDGRLLYAVATDDSHHPGYDSAQAWVWVRSQERSQEAVLAALRDGRFYSSAGPRIEAVEITNEAIEVRCSPAQSVTLMSGRWKGARVNAGRLGYAGHGRILVTNDRGEIVAARLERPHRAPFERIEVEDATGRRAWTNPLWTAR